MRSFYSDEILLEGLFNLENKMYAPISGAVCSSSNSAEVIKAKIVWQS